MDIKKFKELTDNYIETNKEDIIEYNGTVADYLSDSLIELNNDGADEEIVELFGKGKISVAYINIDKFYQKNYNYRLTDKTEKKDSLELIGKIFDEKAVLDKKAYSLLVEILKEHGEFEDKDEFVDVLYEFGLGDATIKKIYLKHGTPYIIGENDFGQISEDTVYEHLATEALFFCERMLLLENKK